MQSFQDKFNLFFKESSRVSTLYISLFSGWFLSVAFQGPVLFGRMEEMNILPTKYFIIGIVIAHFMGLVFAGNSIKFITNIKRSTAISMAVCFVGNMLLFMPITFLLVPTMILCSYFGGLVIAGWGHYYKALVPAGEKLRTAAIVIICSNLVMIAVNATFAVFSVSAALSLSTLSLISACYVFIKHMPSESSKVKQDRRIRTAKISITKPLLLFYAFVTLLSVNSGMMYRIINPAFAQHEFLVNVYWALPYILTICLLAYIPEKINKSYILYISISLIGIAYILFFILDRSALSYVLINTLLLGSFGVCNLFWWTVLGETLEFSGNPVRIFGAGLSANVLGILIGMMIGEFLPLFEDTNIKPMTIAVGIVFLTLIALPLLFSRLAPVTESKDFLVGLSLRKESKIIPGQSAAGLNAYYEDRSLTDREVEIANMLCKGLTYKMISEELRISENTVKTHVKNVYSKLEITSKTELIKALRDI